MGEPRTIDDWIELYADLRPVYRAFVDKLEELLEELLDDEEIDYSWVSSWSLDVSAFESQVYRARREGVQIDDPLDGSVELAGLWVVVATPKAVPEVADIVAREFYVDAARSLSIEDAAAQNERLTHAVSAELVRYAYPRYVVALDERREGLPEWSRFADLRVHIDLATPAVRVGALRRQAAVLLAEVVSRRGTRCRPTRERRARRPRQRPR